MSRILQTLMVFVFVFAKPHNSVAVESSTLMGHEATVNSIALFGNDELLISGSADQTARLWDIKKSREIGRLSLPRSKRTDFGPVAVSPGNDWIATGHGKQGIRIWKRDGLSEVAVLDAPQHVGNIVFSKDGKWVAAANRIWDVGSWKPRLTLPIEGHVLCVRQPSLEILAIVNLRVFDGPSSLMICNVSNAAGRTSEHDLRLGITWTVAFSSNGQYVAVPRDSYGPDQFASLTVHDFATGNVLSTTKFPVGRFTSVAFSPSGHVLAVSGAFVARVTNNVQEWEYGIRLVDWREGRVLTVLGSPKGAEDMLFTTRGQLISGGAGGDIIVWNLSAFLQTVDGPVSDSKR